MGSKFPLLEGTKYVTYRANEAQWCECSIDLPAAEWLDSSAVGIAQLVQAADEFIFYREGWRRGLFSNYVKQSCHLLFITAEQYLKSGCENTKPVFIRRKRTQLTVNVCEDVTAAVTTAIACPSSSAQLLLLLLLLLQTIRLNLKSIGSTRSNLLHDMIPKKRQK